MSFTAANSHLLVFSSSLLIGASDCTSIVFSCPCVPHFRWFEESISFSSASFWGGTALKRNQIRPKTYRFTEFR